ncbi:MAG: hypothetical protein QJR13_06345 [Bacillota bacterium]|nr:hypothetical protein [Bacillota bacterium]
MEDQVAGSEVPHEEEKEQAPSRPLTLAQRGKQIAREAVLSGTLETGLEGLSGFLATVSSGIRQAEEVVAVLSDLLAKLRQQLEEAENPAVEPNGTSSGSLSAMPLKLLWSLIKTQEFQQLAVKMLVKLLQEGSSAPAPQPPPPAAISAPGPPFPAS